MNTEIEAKLEKKEKNTVTLPKAKQYTGTVVYCGPTVHGIARQYTSYSGGIPEALKEFIDLHPTIRGLIVPVERFAKTRRAIETNGTAESVLYQKIKSEI